MMSTQIKRAGKLRDRIKQYMYDARYGDENYDDLDELVGMVHELTVKHDALESTVKDLRNQLRTEHRERFENTPDCFCSVCQDYEASNGRVVVTDRGGAFIEYGLVAMDDR